MKLFFNRIQNLSQKLKKDYPILGVFNIFNPFAVMRFADKLWHAPVPQKLKNFKFVKPSSFLHRQQQLAQTSTHLKHLALLNQKRSNIEGIQRISYGRFIADPTVRARSGGSYNPFLR